MDNEEMITLDSVMSVDLAIKRELEYRKKMELWKIQRQSSSWIPLLPLQEPIPGRAGLKRKSPLSANKLEDFSTFQASSSHRQIFQNLHNKTGLACEVCKIEFSTLFHLKQHCDGVRHKGKLSHMKRVGVTVSNPIRCELCNAPCSGIVVLEQHLTGLKHAAAVEALAKAKHDARDKL